MKISTSLSYYGSGYAKGEWRLSKSSQIQRLYYIKGGKGFYKLPGGQLLPFERGKIYVHPFNLADSFVSDENDPINHLFFDFFTSPPIIAESPVIYETEGDTLLTAHIALLDSEIINQKVSRGTENADSSLRSVQAQKSTVELLFRALLSRLDAQHPLPFASDGAVCETLDYISRNYMNHVSINDIAAEQGFDVSYFIRRFKRVMCVTPYVYLRTYRLMRARELLADGASLERAALEVGYENASSLRRALVDV